MALVKEGVPILGVVYQPYDIAAGFLMMEENGVVFSNERGEVFEMLRDRVLVAGPPSVHGKLLEKVGESYRVE